MDGGEIILYSGQAGAEPLKIPYEDFGGAQIRLIIKGYVNDELYYQEEIGYDGMNESVDNIIVVVDKSVSGADTVKPVIDLDNRDTSIYTGEWIRVSASITLETGMVVWYGIDFNQDGSFDVYDDVNSALVIVDTSWQYMEARTYVVTVLARDNTDDSTQAEFTVTVAPPGMPIVTSKTGDTTVSIGDSAGFTVSVEDDDGTIVSYAWDFEGTGTFDDPVALDQKDAVIQSGHRYNSTGTFDAILKITDNENNVRQDTIEVQVVQDPPVADAGDDLACGQVDHHERPAHLVGLVGLAILLVVDRQEDQSARDNGVRANLTAAVDFSQDLPRRLVEPVEESVVASHEDERSGHAGPRPDRSTQPRLPFHLPGR